MIFFKPCILKKKINLYKKIVVFFLLDFDNDHEILLVHFHQLLDLNPNNLMEMYNGDYEVHSMLMMKYDMNRKMNASFIMIYLWRYF